MLTLPEAEACCARWKLPPLLLEPRPLEPVPGGSSTSSRFRLLRPGRPAVDTLLPLLLVVAREMVIRVHEVCDSMVKRHLTLLGQKQLRGSRIEIMPELNLEER